MLTAIAFPNIDPILFEVGPFVVRWYALAYIAGLLLGIRYMVWLAKRSDPAPATEDQIDDFLIWVTVGVILGGRAGYVIFYGQGHFLNNPLAIFEVWKGGMSFHGGLLGVIVAWLWFCKKRGIPALAFADLIALGAPIGLFFGRISNFINGELYGRATDVPWAMVFPGGGPAPRHPSQLYEAALEGLLLFIIMHLLWRTKALRSKAGALSGVFLIGYGASRMTVELFRQPDAHIGFLSFGATMGQMLSVPMIILGLALIFRPTKTI